MGVQRFLFPESNSFHDELIALQDFVLPAATAIWHFRAELAAALADPEATPASLAVKYNTAPGTRGSTALIGPFLDISWETQRERLAEITLVNMIALYEIWADSITTRLGRDDLAIKLQFPTSPDHSKGIRFALGELTAQISSAMTASIYPSLVSSKKYDLGRLDNLLRCFRFFKELRNCYMHRGRKCDGKLLGAQSEYKPVANEAGLHLGFIPETSWFKLGDGVSLSFHGVLGFTEVLLRIVTTVDAELARSPFALSVLSERIRAASPTPKAKRSLPKLLSTLGFSGTVLTDDLVSELVSSGVVKATA